MIEADPTAQPQSPDSTDDTGGTGTTTTDHDPVAAGPEPDLDELEATLARVQDALGRLDAGTYGRCERCDAEIDDALLAEDPTASSCATCV
ncbi:MAG: hypothetical protein S0880_31970 [Actinomycetota bacterium]|nr:hypothetical protein [Actinomycetota bacterium]